MAGLGPAICAEASEWVARCRPRRPSLPLTAAALGRVESVEVSSVGRGRGQEIGYEEEEVEWL